MRARMRGGWGRAVRVCAALALSALSDGCARRPVEIPVVTPPAPGAEPRATMDAHVGTASWYGPGFHGNRTANGEVYDQHELTAAHRRLPLGTRAVVTNLTNGRSVEVRINDRGPYIGGRVIDLSYAAARVIDMVRPGIAQVRVEVLAARPAAPLVEPPPSELAVAAYTVQIASLGTANRAEHLRRTVALHFPDAFVSELAGAPRPYYRVRIGPYPRAVAVARAELLGRLGYPAIIVEEHP